LKGTTQIGMVISIRYSAGRVLLMFDDVSVDLDLTRLIRRRMAELWISRIYIFFIIWPSCRLRGKILKWSLRLWKRKSQSLIS